MASPLEILAQGPEQGALYWFLGGLSMVKVSRAQSGGSISVIEDHLPPGRATPYHVHRNDDETFYIIEGTATFFSGTQKFQASAGATVFLPREVPHGFRSETEARILIVTTPGGFDEFVSEAGEAAQGLSYPPPQEPDIPRLLETAARFGIEILGPLPD